ncbi:MAG: carboxypeptidase regulatory-like domain-containing protein, partial [Gemmatimonadaceae bacterium]|nr:carboxypeptidase regulatory-like domain-containing protein [Gemmatimonadaceae bacterium]
MMRIFLLALVLGGATHGAAVVGTVRDGVSGDPIAFARIEILDGGAVTWTDSAGAYALPLARDGSHRIRVSRLGYESRLLEVLAGSDSLVRIDVALVAKPARLPRIAVLNARETSATGRGAVPVPDHAEPGARTLQGSDLHANPALAGADALQPLTTIPFVAASPESPTALHIRGGSSDQNLVLLDDVP